MSTTQRFNTENLKQGITTAADRARQLGQAGLARGRELGQAGLARGRELSKKHDEGLLNWLLPKGYDNVPGEGKECICGSDIKTHMLQKVGTLKWIIVALVILVLFLIFYFTFKKSKFSEPLFDYGIKQRRYVQLDGLGTNDSFNKRMGYDKEFQPEYSS